MPRTTPLLRTLNGLIELGWLFIVIGVPVFFNVRDYRVFEPDKIVLLRNVVLAMVLVWLIKAIYLMPMLLSPAVATDGTAGSEPELNGNAPSLRRPLSWRDELRRQPIVVASLIFGLLYVVATLHSILPKISFWGSYDRLEGGYTYLTYITLFLLVAGHLHTWRQVERLVTAVILASVPVAAYSWLQHFSADPLVWFNPDIAVRTPSTLGNPIFLAAYLLMAVPFTLYRLVVRSVALLDLSSRRQDTVAELWAVLGLIGYGAVLVLQLAAIGFSGSRGPALGLLAAVIVFGLCLAIRQRIVWLLRATVVLAALLLLVLGVTNTVYRSDNLPNGGINRFLHLLPSESGTSEVRSLLWKSSVSLAKEHPVLGCGPEVLLFCWYPNYPSELRKVEQANAAPDRSHDEEIDILLTTGVLGLLAYLTLLGTIVAVSVALVRSGRDLRSVALASALIAAFLGHIVEGITGIAFSATLMLLWVIAAVATALRAGPTWGAAASFAQGGEPDRSLRSMAIWNQLETPLVAASVGAGSKEQERGRSAVAATGVQAQGRGNQRSARSSPGNRRQTGQAQGRGGGNGAGQRRNPQRTPGYSLMAAVGRLSGGGKALFGLGTLAAAALIVVGCLLFTSNIAIVLADVSYRAGVNFEQEAGICAAPSPPAECSYQGGPSAYTVGLQLYQSAIDSYQSALDSQPSHNPAFLFLSSVMPSEDTYYLFLGKTILEYAAALDNGPNARPAVDAQVQAALNVFTTAERNNPLNPDHPRNIAKLYSFWGATAYNTIDLPKLRLAEASYARASALAPHNTDILDEWSLIDIKIGESDPAHARQWFAQAKQHLEHAISLYPEGGTAYRDLGRVYAQYGTWAEEAKNSKEAVAYYQQAVSNLLKALGGAPVQQVADHYATVYPILAATYGTKLHQICPAGQYAQFGLNAIKSGALQPPDAHTQQDLQNTVTVALAQKCAISGR